MSRVGIVFTSIIFLCLFNIQGMAQTHSVLSSGKWYKLAVTESNIYSISGAYLENNGITISEIEPEKIRVYGHPSGMLPQANDAFRYSDPEELAIWIEDGGDGSFDSTDRILFWANGPDDIGYDETTDVVTYENNIFSDTSYFFLNLNQAIGKRVTQAGLPDGSYPTIISNLAYDIHEVDQTNILSSGREWYGEAFNSDLNQTFETNISNWISGSEAKITSSVMASSYEQSTFKVSVNGSEVGNHLMSSIPNSQYSIKGQEDTKTFTFTLSSANSNNLEVNYIFEKQSGLGYLNYFLIQTEQNLAYNGSSLQILVPQQTDNISLLEISNANPDLLLWNVADFGNTKQIPVSIESGMLTANIASDTTSWLCAFGLNAELKEPYFISSLTNQDLHANTHTDLLIVTAPEFLNEAEELKSYKISMGINTVVATTNQIYNEFSSGKQDVTAIRDFARYLYQNAGLKHVLLFGKGTFDYKNILEDNLSFVPIYESRNSLSPLYTYGSDDYLAFMEENEGRWEENFSGDHIMDIGVGRLPIKSKEEAQAVVNKIKIYNRKEVIGQWKKKIVFVAENGDGNLHQSDAEKLSTLIDTTYQAFNPKKIYVDAYPIEVYPSKTLAPLVNEAIDETINEGGFIINYTGHGNEEQWAKSNIFNTETINNLNNAPLLPLFVTATCEFGRHDDTDVVSGGEDLVVKEGAGAIGMITTCRPVFANTNYLLNLAFYNEVFSKENGSYKTLGEIFKNTKNNSLNGVNNRNFSLLADPSLTLSYPEKTLQLDSLNGTLLQLTDTIRALEKVAFTGTVRNLNGSINTSFSGKANIAVYDSPNTVKTLGNFDDPFEYKERNSALFVGTSEIKNGNFRFEFVVPLDINYKLQPGKISMYAASNDSTDASGASVSVFIAGSALNPANDTTPPEITLYLEDSTFKNNDLVSANSLVIANLYDENGINLSKSQVGHNISYSLDANEPVSVNDYFQYNQNSYQSGKLLVPIQNLEPGSHTLTLKAYDVYNNLAEQEITFRVASKEEAIITNLSAFPNPMQNHVNITFKHNLNEEELEVIFQVLSRSGELIYSKEVLYTESPSTIDDLVWNGRNAAGQKLTEGIYIFKVFIRSNTSSAYTTHFGKLMIIN